MNEAAKKIIEKANQAGALMQSTTDKLKESDNPQKDGIKLIDEIIGHVAQSIFIGSNLDEPAISATEITLRWGKESQ